MSFLTLFTLCSLLIFNSLGAGDLTSAETTEFLDWHNEVRRNTAKGNQVCTSSNSGEGLLSNPGDRCPGGLIKKLQWNDALAQVALC